MGNISQTFVIQNSTLNIILQSSSQKFAKKKNFFREFTSQLHLPLCEVFLRHFQLIRFVLSSFHMIVYSGKTSFAKSSAIQTFSVITKAFGTLPTCQFSANDALSGCWKKKFVKYVTNCIQNSFNNKIATSRKNMLSSIIIIITIFNDVSDIKNLRGENAIVDLELAAEPWHLEDKYGWYSFQFDTRSKEWLLKEFLNTWKRFGFVSLNK